MIINNKKNIFLFLIYLINIQIFCQNTPGNITEKDFQFQVNQEADAIVLYEQGVVDYKYESNGGFYNTLEVKRQVKIIKKEALQKANIIINYYSVRNYETVYDIKAFCYNYQNGKIEKTKMQKGSIFDKKLDDEWSQVKFTIPDVKEGSIIEYTYTKKSKSATYIPEWYFQEDIPVLWSEYIVKIPEYFDFNGFTRGYKKFDIQEKTTENDNFTIYPDKGLPEKQSFIKNVTRFVQKNVPAFKDETFIACVKDNLITVEFQLAGYQFPNQGYKPNLNTWDLLIEHLLKHEKYGGFLTGKSRIKINSIIEGLTEPKDKMSKIYNYVKENFKVNESYTLYVEQDIKKVVETKTGTSTELNLLLINLLREAELKANPIILSTRSHGKINPGYPLLTKFNFTIAQVEITPTEKYLLDVSFSTGAIGMINVNALNGIGLLVDNNIKQPVWILLQDSKMAKTSTFITNDMELNEKGELKGKSTCKITGYLACDIRSYYLEKKKPNIPTINNFTYKNLQENEKALEGFAEVSLNDKCQINEDFLYLNPMLDYALKENPFKAPTRNYPLDFQTTKEENYYFNISIPAGYKLEEIPKNLRIKMEDNSIKYDFLIKPIGDTKIQIVSKLQINKTIFEPTEYVDLRNLYAQIVAKHQEVIVLKKK